MVLPTSFNLHIPGADLDHVHVGKEVQSGDVHQLGDDGQARCLLGFQQQPDALGSHALEGVGGGPGLEGAPPEKIGPRLLHRLSHFNDLLLALHRAGTGDQAEIAPADFGAAGFDDGILGMEFPVGLLEGLGYPLDGLHNFQTVE